MRGDKRESGTGKGGKGGGEGEERGVGLSVRGILTWLLEAQISLESCIDAHHVITYFIRSTGSLDSAASKRYFG